MDPKITHSQVICLCHTRELAFQVAGVYRKATNFAPEYKISCLLEKAEKNAQVIVTSLGKLFELQKGRDNKIDLSGVKVVVIDEADFFFEDERNYSDLMNLKNLVDN